MRVKIFNIGCRVNNAETQEWKRVIIKREKKREKIFYSLSIINSCSVTKEAQKKTKKMIKKLEKKKQKILITGCYVKKNQIFKNKIFIKNKNKKIIKKILKKINIDKEKKQKSKQKKTFVKIQEGCNNKCSYCIIYKKRGKEKSLNFNNIKKKIKKIIKKSSDTVTVTGINLSSYKSKKKNLKNAIEKILKINKIKNLELGSMEIKDIPNNLYKIWKNKIINKKIHVPLQSGSDKVLKFMNRKYFYENFKKKLFIFKNNIKNILLTTDIIIGFNKEEKEDFNKTKKIIKDVKSKKIHLFRYSKIKGIYSLNFNKNIKEKDKIKRIKKINKIIKEIKKYNEKKTNKNIIYKNKKWAW